MGCVPLASPGHDYSWSSPSLKYFVLKSLLVGVFSQDLNPYDLQKRLQEKGKKHTHREIFDDLDIPQGMQAIKQTDIATYKLHTSVSGQSCYPGGGGSVINRGYPV